MIFIFKAQLCFAMLNLKGNSTILVRIFPFHVFIHRKKCKILNILIKYFFKFLPKFFDIKLTKSNDELLNS